MRGLFRTFYLSTNNVHVIDYVNAVISGGKELKAYPSLIL